MIEAHRELIGIRDDPRRRFVGARAIGAAGIVRQRITREDLGDAWIHGNHQRIAGKSGGVEALALSRGRHRDHLGVTQHLPEALIFREIERTVAAVVPAGNHHRPAIGDAEFIADEGRNALRLRQRLAVEEIARVQRRVPQELERRSVKCVGAGTRHDIGITRGASADFGRHPSGTRVDLFHGIHIEIRERSSAHFGIARIRAIHGEDRRGTALAVDRELLSEIGSTVGIGHGAGGEQQQRAEVALVQGQIGHGFARQFLSSRALAGLGLVHDR